MTSILKSVIGLKLENSMCVGLFEQENQLGEDESGSKYADMEVQ